MLFIKRMVSFLCLLLISSTALLSGACDSTWAPTGGNPACDPRARIATNPPFQQARSLWACLSMERQGDASKDLRMLVKLDEDGRFYSKVDNSISPASPSPTQYTQTPTVTVSRSERGNPLVFRLMAFRTTEQGDTEQALHQRCTANLTDQDFACAGAGIHCWFSIKLTRDPNNLDTTSCELNAQSAVEPVSELVAESANEAGGEATPEVAAENDGGTIEPAREPTREPINEALDAGDPPESSEPTQDNAPPEPIADLVQRTSPWLLRAGGTDTDEAKAIAVDYQGNVIVVGEFNGQATFGSHKLISKMGKTDIFVAKLDPSGNWLWARQVGGVSNSFVSGVVVSQQGFSTITGQFSNTTNFIDPKRSLPLTSKGSSDIFVAALHPNGDWIWAKEAGGTLGDAAYGIALDQSNPVIVGQFQDKMTFQTINGQRTLTSNGFDDIFVAKLNGAGVWQWAISAGGMGTDIARGVAVSSTGDIYLTGAFTDKMSLGTNNMDAAGSTRTELFVAKLNGKGAQWQWAIQTSSPASAIKSSQGIAIDSKGNAVIIGSFAQELIFNSELKSTKTKTNPTTHSLDAFVAKVDANGAWGWEKKVGGEGVDLANAVAIDANDQIYVTGSFTSTSVTPVMFDNHPLTSKGQGDVYAASLNMTGTWLWAKGGGAKNNDLGNGIAIGSTGAIYVVGKFSGTATFDGITPSITSTSATMFDLFIWRLQ